MSETKLPIIVVCSEGAKTSQEIIDSEYLLIKLHTFAIFNILFGFFPYLLLRFAKGAEHSKYH